MNNMSISGAQEKFSAIIDDGKIRLAHKGEQATYIPPKKVVSLHTDFALQRFPKTLWAKRTGVRYLIQRPRNVGSFKE